MRVLSPRFLSIAFLAVLGATLNTALATTDEDSYIAVVTGDDVYVRSGAADSYYPFGRVNKGDLVKVTGEKFNWGRVVTTGPTFTAERFFGYIIYPATQPGRFRLSDDGQTGVTLGRADVLAPNLNTGNNPNDSWKPLIRLPADSPVTVLETTSTANNTVHKIVLPAEAEAWISMAYLRPATDAEQRQWEAAMNPDVPQQDQPDTETAPEPESLPQTDPQPEPTTAPATEPAVENPAAPTVTPVANPESETGGGVEPINAPVIPDAPVTPDAPDASAPVDLPAETAPAVDELPQPESTIEPAEQTAMPSLGNVPSQEAEEAAGEPEIPLAERLAEATLEDLEQAYDLLRKDDLEHAELNPLREMYVSFAARVQDDEPAHASFARSRAEQLALLMEVQQRRIELNQIRARAKISAERAEASRLAVDAGGDYTGVGRLTSSTIYDGKRLPKMLRLQDPGTGRTVAYIEPDAAFDMAGMLGQLIGVIGEKTYDGGLRLNVIAPRRIDILSPR